MGIKQFLEKSAAASERVNIHDIRIEESRPKQRDFFSGLISDSKIREIKKRFEEYGIDSFLLCERCWRLAFALLVVAENRVSELNLKEEDIQHLRSTFDFHGYTGFLSKDYVWISAISKIFSSEKRASLLFSEEDGIKILAESAERYLSGRNLAEYAVFAGVIVPGLTKEFKTEENWKRIQNFLGNGFHTGKIDNLDDYVCCLAWTKVLFPEKVKPMISKELIEQVESEIKSIGKTGDIENFMRLALALKILMAEKVEVVETGLKLKMPTQEDYVEKHVPRPVRLSF